MTSHALWYLTRGTGVVALVLVTSSVLIGIATALRAGGARMPRFVVAGLHRNLSLLTVAFILIHVATTIMDRYAPIGVMDAVVPFVSPYRPVWLGLGAVAFDLVLALVITSLVRVRIGLTTWRGIHWLAYACFPITVVHALGTGSDAAQPWLLAAAIACTALVVAASLARIWHVAADRRPAVPTVRRAAAAPHRTFTLTRAFATAAVVTVTVMGTLWALAGPLAPRWAHRAGTPTASPGSDPLTALAAKQARLDRVRAAQITAESANVRRQLDEIKATLAEIHAASRPIGTEAAYASATASGSVGGSGAVSAAAPRAAAATPTAPVVVTGGS